MKRLMILMMFLMFGLVGAVSANEAFGVFANSNTNNIQFIDPETNTTTGPWLAGQLGSYGGGLFDVAITPDGKKALVSNFGDSKVFCIDISGGFNAEPILLKTIKIPFFAEDIAITPDGTYAVVTDGGFSPRAAVIRVDCCNYLKTNNLGNKSAQAVAITWCENINSYCVVFADYFGRAVHLYTMDPEGDGTLVFRQTVKFPPFTPVNVAISPDGKTVIAAIAGWPCCIVLCFDDHCWLVSKKIVPMPFKNGQSCVFNKAGDKAYYLSNSQTGGTKVVVLNVNGPCEVSPSGTNIKIWPKLGTSQLFGVDTIALDPEERYLYVANPTLSGGLASVAIVDLETNTQVGYIPANGIPTGIAFTTTEDDEE
jgi:DNA-binding beta-propeller fold protein YncE